MTENPNWSESDLLLQSWEFGIPLCRELAIQYESLYDYQSLSWIRVSPTSPSPSELFSHSLMITAEMSEKS